MVDAIGLLVARVCGDEGIEALVSQTAPSRFAVEIRDTEAGETLPTVRFYNDLAGAMAYAERFKAVSNG